MKSRFGKLRGVGQFHIGGGCQLTADLIDIAVSESSGESSQEELILEVDKTKI